MVERDGGAAGRRLVSGTAAVGTFALTGLFAFILVGIAGGFVLRKIGESQAITEAERLSAVLARGVIEPALTEELLTGDERAVAGTCSASTDPSSTS